MPEPQKTRTAPHILHLLPLRNAAGGGVPSSLLALRAALPPETRISVLLLQSSSNFTWVETLRSHGIEPHFANTARQVIGTVARLRPSIVHIHFIEWQVAGTIGALLARARLFWHLHSGLRLPTTVIPSEVEGPPPSQLAKLKYYLATRAVETFFCVSSEIAEYITFHGVPPSKIEVLPNGVDLEHFHPPTNEERILARTKLNLTATDRAIVFFGRDARVKGADRLAEVLERLKHENPNYTVLCVASSTESLSQLSRVTRIQDLGVVAHIRETLWAADILALPSRTEALPFAVLEARATALPVVATDLPGMQQFSEDPGTALVQFDAQVFAASLNRLVTQGKTLLPPVLAQEISLGRWTERVILIYSH